MDKESETTANEFKSRRRRADNLKIRKLARTGAPRRQRGRETGDNEASSVGRGIKNNGGRSMGEAIVGFKLILPRLHSPRLTDERLLFTLPGWTLRRVNLRRRVGCLRCPPGLACHPARSPALLPSSLVDAASLERAGGATNAASLEPCNLLTIITTIITLASSR